MEEKQMNENKEPELKGKMGIVWLVGILVIFLGCVTVYALKLCKENKELKQIPQQVPQPQVVTSTKETKTEETVKEVTTKEEKAETEDKNAKEVYGLDTKFKSLSDVAVKKIEEIYNQDKVSINLSCDLNNDGKKEKITNKGSDIYLNGERIYKSEYYTIESIYVIDINKEDDQKELVLKEIQDSGIVDIKIFNYSKDNKIKRIGSGYGSYMFFDSYGRFIDLNVITSNLTPLLTAGYYQYNTTKINYKKIDLKNVSKQKFIIKGYNNDENNYCPYFIVKNEKEVDKIRNNMKLLDKYLITKDKEITILSLDNGILKIKLNDGSTKYVYSIGGWLVG